MAITPKATTGITTTSTSRFLVDAGSIWLNYGETVGEKLLGATRGGATFEIDQDIREVEIDGTKGGIKGGRRVIEVHARITCHLMELTSQNIMLALAGSAGNLKAADGTVGTTHDEIRRTREIATTDYLTNVALVGKIAGSTENFVGVLFNVLADGGFSIETSDRDEAVVEIQFTAHFDPAKMNEEPWAIRNPATVTP